MKLTTNLAVDYETHTPDQPASNEITCLLVEDERFDRIAFKRLVSRLDYSIKILEASYVSEAREILATEKVDVLFLDNNLPDGLGLVLSRELRNIKKFADLPIILLSGLEDDQFVSTATEAGCSNVLFKATMDSNLLEKILQNVVQTQKSSKAGAPLSEIEMEAALRSYTSERAIELKAPVLRLIRLSRKLQAQIKDGNGADHSTTAAEIEALSFDLQDRLKSLIIQDQPPSRIRL